MPGIERRTEAGPLVRTPGHTPGPWVNAGKQGRAHLVLSQNKHIASVYAAAVTVPGEYVADSGGQAAANAALIAAAPDLLEACREAFNYLRQDCQRVIESNSVCGVDHQPVAGTLDPLAVEAVNEVSALIAKLVLAVGKAEGQPWAQ